MKHFFSTLALVCLAILPLAAEEHQGPFVTFPDAKPQGKDYKPQIAIAQENTGANTASYLILRFTGSTDHAVFDPTSRLLIRFADSTTMTLPCLADHPIRKESSNRVINGTTLSYYRTFTYYQASPDFIDKVSQGIGILKIRIVFAEGNARDYDIAPAYIPKMAELLLKSYSQASATTQQSRTTLSDDDF